MKDKTYIKFVTDPKHAHSEKLADVFNERTLFVYGIINLVMN